MSATLVRKGRLVPTGRTIYDLLGERFTRQVNELWPRMTQTERDRVRHQTTVEGMTIALTDIRRRLDL